tara:strand:+ start:182 stop:697 length:516 start_codon:yes stop_codon:yes gene_type:complete
MFKTITRENFLFPSFMSRLETVIAGIEWHFEKTTAYKEDDNFMFSHLLFDDVNPQRVLHTPYKVIFDPVLYFIKEHIKFKQLLKMKMNLYVNRGKQYVHQPHIDIYDGLTPRPGVITGIFNFTTCDGFTQIEKKKYPSKRNSIILFDGTKVHCGSTPTNTKTRIVLNINLI